MFSKRLDIRQFLPYARDILQELELFLKPHGFSPYQHASKRKYVHDFAVLLAADDLEAVSSYLFDRHGKIIAQHCISIQTASNAACRRPTNPGNNTNPCSPTGFFAVPTDDVARHDTPVIHHKGNDETAYQKYLKVSWESRSIAMHARRSERVLVTNELSENPAPEKDPLPSCLQLLND